MKRLKKVKVINNESCEYKGHKISCISYGHDRRVYCYYIDEEIDSGAIDDEDLVYDLIEALDKIDTIEDKSYANRTERLSWKEHLKNIKEA